jgi:hypothetical protein
MSSGFQKLYVMYLHQGRGVRSTYKAQQLLQATSIETNSKQLSE